MDHSKRCKMRGKIQVSERGLASDWPGRHSISLIGSADWFKILHAFRGPIIESYTRSFLPAILPQDKNFIAMYSA